jgi:pre-60S factor REI1
MAALTLSSAEFVKCNTCKCCFSSTENVKEHYKTDWHVLNSKRRASGLVPLKRDEFKLLKKESKAKAKEESASSSSSRSSAASVVTPAKKAVARMKKVNEVGDDLSVEEGEGGEETSSAAPKPPEPPKLGPNISIFDDHEFSCTDDCLSYMCTNFGFFIPDAEYLSDLDGLLSYLGEKVKLGGYCLYCQKQFAPGRATQNHMVSKSHCKLAYDDEIDGEEYDDFYDFSASYEDIDDDEVELDEDGNVIDGEMQVTHLGELKLPSGRTVGHRDFNRYYKQYHKPEESRPDVLAQQREELLRLGFKFGGANFLSEGDVAGMNDTDVMTSLVKYHKEIRRGQVVERRMINKAAGLAQKRETNMKANVIRSSEQKTQIIRDYHGSLQ